MRSDSELWDFIIERFARNESVVLMVVAESSGSSPGRPGFKMAVSAGDISGSVGGGVMEVALVEKARLLLSAGSTPDSGPVRQVHRKNSEHGSGMICSGEQTVIIKKLDRNDEPTIKNIIDVFDDDRFVLSLSPDSVSVKKSPEPAGFERFTAKDYIYSEKLGRKNELFIIGGGHCALALSEVMSKLRFKINVFDDRPNLNTIEKNKFADQVSILESYDRIDDLVPAGASNYVVVMTIGYKYDKVVISRLLAKDFKYFGVLGSRAKMAVLIRELKQEGFDNARLDAIHTPIGMDINSRTPEEIAVSIAAQIISVKNEED
ncbi:MAG: XdhC family protein [Acidobacteriota bacterium]|nr:XdhC family protein [Acidobacteriota bacterium]MDH3528403.1 XdhC family protein [Acidobacteriota bacterium]